MSTETGKQRSQRIQIDYYRRRTKLDWWRKACILIGLVTSGAYVAYALTRGSANQISTGPLTMVHASFENDCQQCHQDFTPIDGDAIKLDISGLGIRSEASLEHMEQACRECHAVGDHYRAQMNVEGVKMDQACASCHNEHLGRGHALANVASSQCVACHEKLSSVCTGQPRIRGTVTAFTAAAHGEFASLQVDDPGIIKFDHAQHLMPGQVHQGQKGAFTIERLDAALRERYRTPGQMDSDLVQLDCASCHTLAGNPSKTNRMIADVELGRYFARVSFDEHCSACHALNPGIATAETSPIPHAVSWSKVDLFLASTLAGAQQLGQVRPSRDDSQSTPLPGTGLGAQNQNSDTKPGTNIASLRRLVESQCLKCHDEASIKEEAIQSRHVNAPEPMIPARWLKHGLYDHAAHRQIECRYCHAAAYGDGAEDKPAQDQELVMISGIETCVGCHRDANSPAPSSITQADVKQWFSGQADWASDQCMLCHRYHTWQPDAPGTLASVKPGAAP
jgi:hypothetical protein